MQKVRSQAFLSKLKHSPPTAVGEGSDSISSLKGFFSPFPHGTSSLSDDDTYLALEGGLQIQTEFHVFRSTREIETEIKYFNSQGYHLLWHVFPNI